MAPRKPGRPRTARTLAVVLGDQLDLRYPEALGLDREADAILMMEVAGASEDPPSHVQRTVLFLSAMRHHAEALREDGWRVDYRRLTTDGNSGSFEGELAAAIERLGPERATWIRPGAFHVQEALASACEGAGIPHEMVEDPHFLCTVEEFEDWAEGRKQLVMEYFYRMMRKRLDVLMTKDGRPRGGEWNYDKRNRKAFKATPRPPAIPTFAPDEITEQVIDDVRTVLPDLPGRLESFPWAVTREQALETLEAFCADRLHRFGDYQDAMWTEQDTLYHSVISSSINLKLLDPREVYRAALEVHDAGDAPINAVEGFVRQIIGWREFIRGVYWHEGPDYVKRNELGHHGALPELYWTGETDMTCLRDALRSVLDTGYGHHIARLMVTGNFGLIAGIHPRAVHDWYQGMYVDAVEWATTPNTIGMSLHADGGVVGTKPYAASGQYVRRMSNYCEHCDFDPKRRHGDGACPFSVFYWDFLIRHESRFEENSRMALILKNLDRIDADERVAITVSARSIREDLGIGDPDGD